MHLHISLVSLITISAKHQIKQGYKSYSHFFHYRFPIVFIIKQLFIKQQKKQYTLVKISLRNIYDVESFFVETISLWMQMAFLKFQRVFFQNTYEQPLLLNYNYLALICKIFGTDWMNLLVLVLNEEGDLNCA